MAIPHPRKARFEARRSRLCVPWPDVEVRKTTSPAISVEVVKAFEMEKTTSDALIADAR